MAYSIGSVETEVGIRLDDIPSAISGTGMNNIVIGVLNYASKFTGNSIGSNAIAEAYFEPIVKLTMVEVQKIIERQGADKDLRLGEFSVSAASSASKDSIETWKADADEMLRMLQENKYGSYQCW